MSTKSIPRISKYLLLGLLVLITACSPLVVIERTTDGTPLPTRDIKATDTAVLQTIPAQTPTQATVTATATPNEVLQPTATSAPIKNDTGDADGKVTAASIGIQLEQGSGAVCTTDSTYFVHATITADGATTASYEIGSTAGQIAAGYFQDSNGGLSPYVSGTLVFDQADTKNIHLRFVGPYPYPEDITVFLRVNSGEFYNTKLSCNE